MPRQRSVPGGEWGEPPWGPVVPFRCPSWGSAAIILHLGGGGHSAARCPPQQRVKGMGGGGGRPPARLLCPVGSPRRGGGPGLTAGIRSVPCVGGGGLLGEALRSPSASPPQPGRSDPTASDKMEAPHCDARSSQRRFGLRALLRAPLCAALRAPGGTAPRSSPSPLPFTLLLMVLFW